MNKTNDKITDQATLCGDISEANLMAIGQEALEWLSPPPVALFATSQPDRFDKITVEARAEEDDRLLHSDRLNPQEANARSRFGKAVAKAAKDLATTTEIELRLMELEPLEDDEDVVVLSTAPQEEDLAISSLIRPGGFITPALAGQLTPRLVKGLDLNGLQTPKVRFEFILCHKNGKRDRIPFNHTLMDQDDNELFLSSKPPTIKPSTIRPSWRRESQNRWLEGETPSIDQVRDQLAELIASRVWFPPDLEEPLSLLMACFVILTHLIGAVDVVPYLHVSGPKGSGKTQAVLGVFVELVYKPLPASDVSGPVIFRTLDGHGGTLIVDEAEQLNSQSDRAKDLTGILNAGHSKGYPARRCEREGDEIVVREFDCFGPKVICGIADLPDTLASRCISLPMLRRPKDVKISPCKVDIAQLRDDLHALILTHAIELQTLLRSPGDMGLDNRTRDLWLPLLRIAGWFDPDNSLGLVNMLRTYADEAVVTAEQDHGVSDIDEILLLALHERVRTGTSATTTSADLLADVQVNYPRLFDQWTPRRVSAALGRYGLKTKKRRCGKNIKKVYAEISLDRLKPILTTYGVELPYDEAGGEVKIPS